MTMSCMQEKRNAAKGGGAAATSDPAGQMRLHAGLQDEYGVQTRQTEKDGEEIREGLEGGKGTSQRGQYRDRGSALPRPSLGQADRPEHLTLSGFVALFAFFAAARRLGPKRGHLTREMGRERKKKEETDEKEENIGDPFQSTLRSLPICMRASLCIFNGPICVESKGEWESGLLIVNLQVSYEGPVC